METDHNNSIVVALVVKGSGEYSYKLALGKNLKMKDVIYVLGLNNNLLSISTLDAKGIRVAFVDVQVLMWKKERQ